MQLFCLRVAGPRKFQLSRLWGRLNRSRPVLPAGFFFVFFGGRGLVGLPLRPLVLCGGSVFLARGSRGRREFRSPPQTCDRAISAQDTSDRRPQPGITWPVNLSLTMPTQSQGEADGVTPASAFFFRSGPTAAQKLLPKPIRWEQVGSSASAPQRIAASTL